MHPKAPVGVLRVPLPQAEGSASFPQMSLKYVMIKKMICLEALVQLQSTKQMQGDVFLTIRAFCLLNYIAYIEILMCRRISGGLVTEWVLIQWTQWGWSLRWDISNKL